MIKYEINNSTESIKNIQNNYFIPPTEVRNAARIGLQKRLEKSISQRYGTDISVNRAEELAKGKPISFYIIKKMYKFFNKYDKHIDSKWNDFSKARQAWELNGGESGKKWVFNIINKLKNDLSIESGLDKTDKLYVLLFTGMKHNLTNKLISLYTKSDFTHAGLSLDKNLYDCYDVITTGLRHFNAKKSLNEDRLIYVYSIPISIFQKKQIYNIINLFKNSNIKYDKISFIKLALPIKINMSKEKITNKSIKEKNEFICSAFVISILTAISPKIKNYLIKQNLTIELVTPGEISKYPDLTLEYIYNPKFKKIVSKNKI